LPRIDIVNEEANTFLQNLCDNFNWAKNRAVLFLDPYGMQVEWKTIESIARTKAIDMWLLFPLGMSINRMLKKDGNIPRAWVEKLDRFFGTHDWEQQFYRQQIAPTLFGDQLSIIKTCNFEVIEEYFIGRLKTIFPCVAENPLTLCNSRNIPLFLLCFAAGNEKGGKIAKRIAEYILRT
jgi:three-Cys-motif partner protein